MDFDPSAGSDADALSLYFPLPFRVASIIVFGVSVELTGARRLTMNRSLGMGRESPISPTTRHRRSSTDKLS
jgi:hypothetical protein